MEPQRIAVGIVRLGDRFLVGTRLPGQAMAGLAEFPGGKLLPGETVHAGLLREIMEETGLMVKVGEWSMEVEHVYPHGHCRITFVECLATDEREPKEPFRWLTLSVMEALEFPAGNKVMWQQYRHERLNKTKTSPRETG